MSAMLYHILDIDWNDNMSIEPFTKSDINQFYQFNMECNKIDIDEYVYDRHCKEGRNKGKDLIDFAKNGSLVVNQDNNYFNPLLRDLYIYYFYL